MINVNDFSPVRVGVIGVGNIGIQHIDALRRIPGVEITALCQRNADALLHNCQHFCVKKGYTDWREMIDDNEIDVIHNCTPNNEHFIINKYALLGNKHVYSEKPLCQSSQEAAELYSLARKLHLGCGLNHQYRMNAPIQEMAHRLKNGECGKPLGATGCYLQESASRQEDWSPKMEYGDISRAVCDIGIHWVDLACCVLKQPVKEVMADLQIHYPCRHNPNGEEVKISTEDSAFILVHFADGTPGQVTISKSANGHKNDLRLNIWCENYSMEWNQEDPDILTIGEKGIGFTKHYMNPKKCSGEVLPYITTPMGHVMGWSDGLRNSISAFYSSLADGSFDTDDNFSLPYSTFYNGYVGMAFTEACVKSSQQKKWVTLEQLSTDKML